MRSRQMEMDLSRRRAGDPRGGKRKGCGRKPKGVKAGVPHRRREVLKARTALHVTVRCGKGEWRLRRRKMAAVLAAAFRAGCARDGFRICQFSVQGNHLHLVIEADSAVGLAEGMRAWTIRVARAINRTLGRKGKVFPDRY
ncbi:MAG TPA: transposase, partial [Kofleriaceae bacterium]|nr:transposase [Kofleriaceae bacterium]